MGRPKGSKNKPKVVSTLFTPEIIAKRTAKLLKREEGIPCKEPAPIVIKKSRKSRKPPTSPASTSSVVESVTTSVESVTTQTVDTHGQKKSSRRLIEGWVNLQRAPDTRFSRGNYYTGADIHKTIEDAKKVASHSTVGQFFLSCEVKE